MATVLLIEDDAESRRATGELFMREGWTILEAGDGDAGVECALKHRPDLILCDLLMPKANGFQVCRSIRDQLQPAKIIIVSGRDYGVDRTSALDAGAVEYLVKPIRWENLREVIDRVLPSEQQLGAKDGDVPEFTPPATRLKFWGVRGSIPVPGASTVRYGGNTSCVEVRADGQIIILDAGSGIRVLGLALEEEFGTRPMRLTMLVSHTHWDHVQGLPFFLPAYHQRNSLRVAGYGGETFLKYITAILEGHLEGTQRETAFFPVNLRSSDDLQHTRATIVIDALKEMEFPIGKVQVHARYANHPNICVGYRLHTSNGSIAYFPDNEPYERLKETKASRENRDIKEARLEAAAERAKLVEFLRHSNVLIMDAQYTDEEYSQRIEWGHGSISSVVNLALDAEVGKLYLFHHDPNHADSQIDEMVQQARTIVLERNAFMEVEAAAEGAEVWLGAKPKFGGKVSG